MDEGVSLRDIFGVIWRFRVLILITTVIAAILSGLLSFFVLPPTYEVKSTVRIENRDADGNQIIDLISFVQTIESDVAIKRIIDKLDLDSGKYSIASVRNLIQTELVKDTNVIQVTVRHSDPEVITDIANLMAFEIGARTEITNRSISIIEAQNQLLEINDLIIVQENRLASALEILETTPEKLVTRKSLSDDPFLQSVITEEDGVSSRDAGALELYNEEINPVFTAINQTISETQLTLSNLNSTKRNLENTIQMDQDKIGILENEMDNEKLRSVNSQRLLNGANAVFISPSIQPVQPVGPNKILNISISVLIGFIIGVMIAFFRHYWYSSNIAVRPSDGKNISA